MEFLTVVWVGQNRVDQFLEVLVNRRVLSTSEVDSDFRT